MPVYLPVGPQYPDIVSSPRKFRAYDEPERKADFEPFTEFHGPHIPPTKLGSPGDVYLNTKGANLYLKVQDKKWSLWEGTRQTKLAHPSFPNRFLWVYRSSIQFYSDTFIKANKITNREVVLRSIITLLSKGSSRKRTADEAFLDTNCLNTKKGIKGRLSTVEEPPNVGESLPQQSISAPVRSSGNPIQSVRASPPRAHSSASLSPPASEDVESLKLEVERLRKALEEQRAGVAMASNSKGMIPADPVQANPVHVDSVPDESMLENINIGKPQLQSPPPTPSLLDQMPDFSTQNMHQDELIFPSPVRSPVPEPQSTNADLGSAVFHETEERKPEVIVKTEANPPSPPPPPPPIAPSTKSNTRETIDLTGDSDDDIPSVPKRPRHTLPLPRKAPSSPSYAPLVVRSNNAASSSKVTQTPLKSRVSSTPTVNRSSHTPSRLDTPPAASVSGITHTPPKPKVLSTPAVNRSSHTPSRLEASSAAPSKSKVSSTPIVNRSSHTPSRLEASSAASDNGISHTPSKSKVSSTPAVNRFSHTPSKFEASPAASVNGITHTPSKSKVSSTPAVNRFSHTPSRLEASSAASDNGITHTPLKSKVSIVNRFSHTPSKLETSSAASVNGITHTPSKPKSSSASAASRSNRTPSHNQSTAADVGRAAHTPKSKPPPAAVVKEEEGYDSDIEIITGEQFEAEKKVKENVNAFSGKTQPVTRDAYTHQVKSEPVAEAISRDDSPMLVVQPQVKSEPAAEAINRDDSPMLVVQPQDRVEEAPETSASSLALMEPDANVAAVSFDNNTGAMDEDFDLEMDNLDLVYPDEEPLPTPADATAPVALSEDVKMEEVEVEVKAQQDIVDSVPGDAMVSDIEDEVPVNSGFTRELVHFFFEKTKDLSGLGCRLCPPRTRETFQSNATRLMGNHLLDAHKDIFDASTIDLFSQITEKQLYEIYPLR